MAFAANLLENAILVLPRVGHLHPIFKPHRGFFLFEFPVPPWGICKKSCLIFPKTIKNKSSNDKTEAKN